MRITSLLENTTSRTDIKTEHGLSLYIETEHHKILFDMGQTSLFADNAETLGVDLSAVNIAVLSHGHYDHGGGLRKFLELNRHAPVYIHRDAFCPHYNGAEKYIGLDPSLAEESRFVFTEHRVEIGEGITLFSCNGWKRRYAIECAGLTEKAGEYFIPDDFRHEQYLLICEKGKRVLISGCSHKGILDIAEWFSPDILVGGFHFSKMPLDGTLAEAAKRLSADHTEYYTCHCTGMPQFSFMKEYMGNLRYLSCGESIEF